jgi:hypothetical protein
MDDNKIKSLNARIEYHAKQVAKHSKKIEELKEIKKLYGGNDA